MALLGRERELRALLALVDGPGGVAVVHGPAGIGKSALLAAVRAQAQRRGLPVHAAAGVAPEAALPYAALERLLHGLLDRAGALRPPSATRCSPPSAGPRRPSRTASLSASPR